LTGKLTPEECLEVLFTGATIKHFPREKLKARQSDRGRSAKAAAGPVNRARPIETQLGLLEAANKCDREARDLLLPRLMSGEIEV